MIVILLIIIVITYLLQNYVTKIEAFTNVKPRIIKKLYSMLDVIDRLFTKHDIEYWISDGTMLGAIRHKGIIPWDDDGDIQVREKYEDKIATLSNELKQHGLTLMKTWFGYKIFPTNGEQIKGFKWKYPAIDIFIMTEKNDMLEYKYEKAKKLWGDKCDLIKEHIYPLQRYEFGKLKLQGISSKYASEYLDRCYGNDWNDYAYREYDHETESIIKKIKVKLSDEDRRPATY